MNDKSWISHIEWAVMFVTLIGGFYSIDSRIDAVNIRVDSTIEAMNNRFDQFLITWHEESKDFHARLCLIDERNKNK